MMILQYIATIATLVALALQVAVWRAPDIEDSADSKPARRLLIAGLAVFAGYMLHASYSSLPGNAWMLWGLLLLCLGEAVFCMNRLFPNRLVRVLDALHLHTPHSHSRGPRSTR